MEALEQYRRCAHASPSRFVEHNRLGQREAGQVPSAQLERVGDQFGCGAERHGAAGGFIDPTTDRIAAGQSRASDLDCLSWRTGVC